jgi:CHAD domain-containing protein
MVGVEGGAEGAGRQVREVSGSALPSFGHSNLPTAAARAGRLHLLAVPSERALIDALRKHFRVRVDGREHGEWMLLDTFDGRFARKGCHLVWLRDVEQFLLALLKKGDEVADAKLVTPLAGPPEFARQLAPGRLHDRVERIAGLRRLHPVALVAEAASRYRIVDDEDKTRVRLRFADLRARVPGQPDREVALRGVLQVTEVRGYQSAFDEVAHFLTEERGLEPAAGDAATRALVALGQPAGAVPRVAVSMAPADAAARVALWIQRALLDVMKANLAGIRTDSDVEHLHDFRVAARRSRTLLKTFRPLLAGPEVDAIRDGFAWLGGATGPTRDADVHLLDLDRASGDLPREDREALLPLITHLSERRQQVWKNLVEALDSPRFTGLVEQIEALTDPAGGFARSCPESPTIAEFAARQLAQGYGRLLKRGRKLRRHAPDAAVHRARIEGKRLRYLFEFFSSLYPTKQIEPVIKSLRRLQNELGSFNDAAVQQQVLRELARDRAEEGGSSADELLALGRLIERLEREKERSRAGAARRFTRFDSGATRESFERQMSEYAIVPPGREGV